ncbi:MAG: FeoC-like transcriptional regulator [Anaerovoracaceae bacterium]|jgi:Mn-dependent DtxR family transcriptional regulator
MIKSMLRLLENGETYTTNELARKLDLSLETVHAIVDYLDRTGLLIRIKAEGCQSCKGCKVQRSGARNRWPVLWVKQVPGSRQN